MLNNGVGSNASKDSAQITNIISDVAPTYI